MKSMKAILGGALLLAACRGEVTLFDLNEVRADSLAFVVYLENGEAVATSAAVGVDAEGNVAFGSHEHRRLGSESALIIVSYESLRQAVGPAEHTLTPARYADAVLHTQPVDFALDSRGLGETNGRRVWVGGLPSDSSVQPPGIATDFLRQLQIQLPTVPDSVCNLPGVLRDVDSTGGFTGIFKDVLPVGKDRALVLHAEEIIDIHLIDGGFRRFDSRASDLPGAGSFWRIEQHPMAPERIFVSRFVGGAGAIEEFQLLQEGLRHVETTHLPRLLPVPMVVTPTGDILAIGDATDTAGVHSVWIRNGNVESLKFVSDGERVVRATGPVPPEDHIFTGTKGGVHKLPRPDASWRTDPLSDNTTQVRVNGLAHRLLQDNAELWIAADTGRVFRRLADGDPMGQQVLTPPNFSCIDADTPRLSLNLMDIAIPDNATYALIALEFCRELLVFDLDGGQCASTIPYEGTSLESLSRRVRVLNTDEGLEIWTVGENFIRHAYVR